MAARKKKDSAKRSKKTPTTLSSQLSSEQEEEIPLSLPEQLNIDQVVKQALVRYKGEEIIKDKKEKLKELTHLNSVVEEYLSCFTLIGFTLQGEKVCLFNASNSKDEGALVDLLRSTFLEIANNRP